MIREILDVLPNIMLLVTWTLASYYMYLDHKQEIKEEKEREKKETIIRTYQLSDEELEQLIKIILELKEGDNNCVYIPYEAHEFSRGTLAEYRGALELRKKENKKI